MGGVFTSKINNRSYYKSRGADIPHEVLIGDADVGFCGSDVFKEGWLSGGYRSLGFIALADAGCDLVLALPNGKQVTDEPLQIATSYPWSALYYCKKLGLETTRLNSFGGKIEGKVAEGTYNAVVDIKESGETLKENGLTVVKTLSRISTGLVFKIEDYKIADYVFEV